MSTPTQNSPQVNTIEIFSSLEGECANAGMPTIFVRLAGCDVKCPSCDTKHSWTTNKSYTEDEVVEKIIRLLLASSIRRISFTGGNPLLQIDSILSIIDKLKNSKLPFNTSNLQFNLEHPGYYSHSEEYSKTLLDLLVFDTITMDVKLFFETSNLEKQNMLSGHIALALAAKNIVLKVMVTDNTDLEVIRTINDSYSKVQFENYYTALPKYIAVIRNSENEIDTDLLNKTIETLQNVSNFKLNYPMHVALNFR